MKRKTAIRLAISALMAVFALSGCSEKEENKADNQVTEEKEENMNFEVDSDNNVFTTTFFVGLETISSTTHKNTITDYESLKKISEYLAEMELEETSYDGEILMTGCFFKLYYSDDTEWSITCFGNYLFLTDMENGVTKDYLLPEGKLESFYEFMNEIFGE